jgi:murein L,D-transpeptidase YcbB/YkuD
MSSTLCARGSSIDFRLGRIAAGGVTLALAGLLLLGAGPAAADLRETLSPFVATDEPDAEPPAIAADDAELALFSPRLLAEFYAERDYRAAWTVRHAQALLRLARESRNDGFVPNDFHADAVAAVLDRGDLDAADPALRDRAELLLSDALVRYVHHFRFGKHNPERLNRGWTFVEPADAEQLKADLRHALDADDLATELAARLPNPDFYRNLKKGYQRYLAIADRGGWDEIANGPNLSVGAKDARVPLIREHLQVIDGYDPGYVAEPDVYDEALAEAIKGFQRRSGLSADGVVGPNTLRALNHPLDQRLLAIRANLERMRWLYNDLPEDYIFVDLTAFELFLVRGNEEAWRTKGIIGTVQNQTPMFRDEMEYMVFNPTWTVPESIAKKYKGVPAGYRRVRSGGRYYLVQQPGPRNALGRVKFMFPNGHAIYLHDTPSRYLFGRAQRAYSHGCIRVHQPLTLAQQILNKPAWSEAEINRVVRRGSTRWVHLDEHLPVLLYYLTAFADDEGRVGFRRDIYNRDRRLFAALDEPVGGAERIAFAEPEPAEPELEAEAASEAIADEDAAEQAVAETLAEAPAAETAADAPDEDVQANIDAPEPQVPAVTSTEQTPADRTERADAASGGVTVAEDSTAAADQAAAEQGESERAETDRAEADQPAALTDTAAVEGAIDAADAASTAAAGAAGSGATRLADAPAAGTPRTGLTQLDLSATDPMSIRDPVRDSPIDVSSRALDAEAAFMLPINDAFGVLDTLPVWVLPSR